MLDGLCLAAGPRGCKQLLQAGSARSAPRRSTACSISCPACAVRGPMRRRRTASASSPSSAHGSAASRPQPAECSTQHASHPIARHCTSTAAAPHWAAPEKAMPPCHSSQLIQAETVALAGLINPLHASPRSDPLRCRPPAAPAKAAAAAAATSRIVVSPYRRAADAVRSPALLPVPVTACDCPAYCSLLPPLPSAHSPYAASQKAATALPAKSDADADAPHPPGHPWIRRAPWL
jgi:hypothetical protein